MKSSGNKVILVDDDEDDRYLFVEVIEDLELSAKTLCFENGRKFFDFLSNVKVLDEHRLTYLFLDLNMPVISGIECLKLVRDNEQLDNIFVIIYSTSSSKQDIEKAYQYGANCYLKKSNSYSRLKASISKALSIGIQNNGKQLPKEKFLITEEYCL